MALRAWALAILASALLTACTRHSSMLLVPSRNTEVSNGPAQPNLGASILASIDDARRAIAFRDPIAADNDISQALESARQAIDQVLPGRVAGSDAQALTALLRSFSARVRLVSTQALLTSGDVAQADAILMALQNRVPPRLVPQNLPLVEAAASLDRAKQAAALGIPQLRTQLSCAQAALRSYHGPADVEETMALASTLSRALADPTQLRTLLPYQVSIWLGSVAQWRSQSARIYRAQHPKGASRM